MSQQQPDLSLVIPVFNEASAIAPFFQNLQTMLTGLAETVEIIFVDDGSSDRTFEIIEDLARRDPRVSGLQFSRNFGKEAALLAGLEQAQGRAVLTLDGDGQHPVCVIPQLVGQWKTTGAKVVKAVKSGRDVDGFWGKMNARIFNFVMTASTGMDMTNASDFMLMDRDVVDAIRGMRERNRLYRGLASWVGFHSVQVPFDVSERLAGKTKWNNWRLFMLAVNAITAFTSRPLNWIFGLGVIGVLISFILTLQALWSRIDGVAVSGWTSLTIVILFFGSANLMAVGMVGIYLARVFDEVKARPLYFIQKKI